MPEPYRDARAARAFARGRAEAWTGQDVEAMRGMCSPGVVFSTPMAAQLLGESGVFRGVDALEPYWRSRAQLMRGVEYTAGEVNAGVRSLLIEYRVSNGGTAREVLLFDADGLVEQAHALYPM